MLKSEHMLAKSGVDKIENEPCEILLALCLQVPQVYLVRTTTLPSGPRHFPFSFSVCKPEVENGSRKSRKIIIGRAQKQ